MTAKAQKQVVKNHAALKAADLPDAPTATGQAIEAQGKAEEPEKAPPRTTMPVPPFLVGPNSQQAAATIMRALAETQKRPFNAAGAQRSLLIVRSVTTRHLHPGVAVYKAEAMEYLVGLVS